MYSGLAKIFSDTFYREFSTFGGREKDFGKEERKNCKEKIEEKRKEEEEGR